MKVLFQSILILLAILTLSCENKTISTSIYGVGPVEKLELETISDSLMKRGLHLFNEKCSQCHTMEFKNSGPDISDILAHREPEWIVNFLINKEEMLTRDSLALITRIKYEVDCGSTITTQQEAIEILEYLRIYQIWLHEFNVK